MELQLEGAEPQRKDPEAGGGRIHLGISKFGSLVSEVVTSLAGASCCGGARVHAVCVFHTLAKSFMARC
eukprot:10029252-Alexandrium_andersonii.AAC.1